MTQRGSDGRQDEEPREQDERALIGRAEAEDDADVFLDIPVLNVEELHLEVEELRAHISARAELAGFLNIDVGVSAYVDKVKLSIKGVEAQVQLKVKLERILGSIDRALQAIDNNPQLLDPDHRRKREGPEEEGGVRRIPAGPQATSAARKRADELGLDLSGIDGTGSGGRILVRDVEKAAGG